MNQQQITDISRAYSQRVFEYTIGLQHQRVLKKAEAMVNVRIPHDVLKCMESHGELFYTDTHVEFFRTSGGRITVNIGRLALPKLKPIKISDEDFEELQKLIAQLDLLNDRKISLVIKVHGVLSKLNSREDIVRYMPEVLSDVDKILSKEVNNIIHNRRVEPVSVEKELNEIHNIVKSAQCEP